jgi:hypothetical protein
LWAKQPLLLDLGGTDKQSVAAQKAGSRDMVLERLEKETFHTVTLDFDGRMQSAKPDAEGTAVGLELVNWFQESRL